MPKRGWTSAEKAFAPLLGPRCDAMTCSSLTARETGCPVSPWCEAAHALFFWRRSGRDRHCGVVRAATSPAFPPAGSHAARLRRHLAGTTAAGRSPTAYVRWRNTPSATQGLNRAQLSPHRPKHTTRRKAGCVHVTSASHHLMPLVTPTARRSGRCSRSTRLPVRHPVRQRAPHPGWQPPRGPCRRCAGHRACSPRSPASRRWCRRGAAG